MKRGPFLLDTGFVIALVNSCDPAHESCARVWSEIQGPFISTDGVMVEAAWLLRKKPDGFSIVATLLRSVATIFVAPTSWRFRRSIELMARYRDVPMDLVDALLVSIGDEARVRDVLTLDRRGFTAYRTGDGRAFRTLP